MDTPSSSTSGTSKSTGRHANAWTSSANPALSASSSAPIGPPSSKPASSASIRPSSSAPIRSSSSMSSRTSTTLSARTTWSSRPTSRMTHRPASRSSHRPTSRQSSRLLSQYEALVTQVTGLTAENDQENIRTAVDFVSKNLDQTIKPSGSVDMSAVEKHINGHIQKARINCHDALATALKTAHGQLTKRANQQDDLDSEIKMSRLPDHLQLLILLSLPPDQATLANADEFMDKISNPRKPPSSLTWKDILAEEPFEGQHWEGVYGLPPGSTVEDQETHSGGSTPSLSPWDDSDLDDSLSSSDVLDLVEETLPQSVKDHTDIPHQPHLPYGHRQDVEDLQARQYWRPQWHTDASTTRPFNIGDSSTLGPAMYRALAQRTSLTLQIDSPDKVKYIHEHDAVREVLMGLQGRRNVMMTWAYGGDAALSFSPTSANRLLHLTAVAQTSILTSFASSATTLEHLRKFVSAIFTKASQITTHGGPSKPYHFSDKRSTLTLEAFAAAVDLQIRGFNTWCASKEEEICKAQAGFGPPLVVSLLSLDKAIRDHFSATFVVLLNTLQEVVKRASRTQEFLREIWTLSELPLKISPSAFTALLLDSLLDAAQEHISMGDVVTANALMRVFGDTAEPIWSMLGHWMKNGMPVRDLVGTHETRAKDLDDEFFVEDNEMPILDPDFWTDGFVLRHREDGESKPISVPTFLAHVAQIVLDTGKAIGLLRVLGIPNMFDRDVERQWMTSWREFGTLLQPATGPTTSVVLTGQSRSVVASTDALSRLIYDELLPFNLSAQNMLHNVLVDDCELWMHLSSMEGLYLMRRGDAMSHFIDILFSRMDSKQAWNDFHFLNSAFRDVVEAGPYKWINASLVRLSHRGSKDKSISRTVRAIDGLFIEYAVPFPLTYIFGPRVMQVYSSIFSFVLQIRRAKSVLERILVRGAVANLPHVGSDMKLFYAMRSKLSWFVNTLLNFVATNVLHTQLLSFHSAFKQAKSLNDMIQLHNEHLAKIEGRCLLQRNTAALQRAIISILDMTLHFSDCFIAFAGDTTHDISRHSILIMKRHRSRRARRQRRDVIGFSQVLREADDSSDSDSDLDDDLGNRPEPSFSLGASTMSVEGESFLDRLDKMSTELDALVRFVRRGVESLAAGSGEAASAFGIFAFALEDWDR